MMPNLSDDSANVVALLADMYHVTPSDAVDLYERLCGRPCRPTEGEALDATLQAILDHHGPLQSAEVPFVDQPRSEFIERTLAEIRQRSGGSILARIVGAIRGAVGR